MDPVSCYIVCAESARRRDLIWMITLLLIMLLEDEIDGKINRCSKFSFPCNNSNICVPQQSWCDNVRDCPFGDDEAPNCRPKVLTWDNFKFVISPCVDEVRKAKNLPSLHKMLNFRAATEDEMEYSTELPEEEYFDDNDDLKEDHEVLNVEPNCALKGLPQSCKCVDPRGYGIHCEVAKRLPNLTQVVGSPIAIEIHSTTGTMACLGANNHGLGIYSFFEQLITLNLSQNGLPCLRPNVFKSHNLVTIDLSHNHLSTLTAGTFNGVDVCSLYLNNNLILDWPPEVFSEHSAILWLDLRNNHITLERRNMLRNLRNTRIMELTGNRIRTITNETFRELIYLDNLELSKNRISRIEEGAFAHLRSLTVLNLGHNQITTLPANLLHNNSNLRQLELAYNDISEIPDKFFQQFNCTKLDLRGLIISNIDEKMFSSLPSTCNVLFEKMYYCFLAHHIRNCTPKGDGISSFEHLLVSPLLVALAWHTAIFTIVANLAVFIARWHLDRSLKSGIHDMVVRDARVMSLFIKHLSFSDLLTGFYILFICYYNELFKGRYNKCAVDWVNSLKCKALGIVAMSSAEISMMILTLIAVDRFATIVGGLSKPKCSICTIRITLTFLWIIGLGLAIIPAVIWGDRIHNYYGNNGVCLPLYLQEPHLNGWRYSLVVIIGLNGLMITIIILAYGGIFLWIRRWRKSVPIGSEERELLLRFFILIFLNLCCWLPTFVCKLLALTSYKIPDATYAWIVTFVFPLNSAMNPVVYSLSSGEFRSRVSHVTGCYRIYSVILLRLHVIRRRLSAPWSSSTPETSPSDEMPPINANIAASVVEFLGPPPYTPTLSRSVSHDRHQKVPTGYSNQGSRESLDDICVPFSERRRHIHTDLSLQLNLLEMIPLNSSHGNSRNGSF